MEIKKIAAIGVSGLAAMIAVSFVYIYGRQQAANIQILNLNAVHTGGEISGIQYIISGSAVNSGVSTSHPVILLITVLDDSKNILHITTTSPEPDTLQPGQEAPFYKQITYDDLGGYRGRFVYRVSVQQK
ncbi:MAG: hypothetical protein WBQ25_06750 [Nitrososphaeraceae archaeon]